MIHLILPNDIDDGNELVVWEIGGDGEAEDDKLVFYDNTLTWGIVANVTRISEPLRYNIAIFWRGQLLGLQTLGV